MKRDLKKKYAQLVEIMNTKTLMKNPPVSGLLKCFEIMMSEEEADFLLAIGEKKVPYDELRTYYKGSDAQWEKFIYGIMNKGMIWLTWNDDGSCTGEMAPIFPGWIEVSLSDGKKTPEKIKLAKKFSQLLVLKRKLNIWPLRRIFLKKYAEKMASENAPITMSAAHANIAKKSIKLNQNLENDTTTVMPAAEVYSLIDSLPDDYPMAVMHCFCRFLHEQVDSPCRFKMPLEACIGIGSFGRQTAEYNIGRAITKAEAKEIIAKMEDMGAFHNIFHYGLDSAKPEIAICNCCWDCDCLYGIYNRGGLAPMYLKAHYRATIKDESKCVGCNTCNNYCPSNATGFDMNTGKLRLEADHCIGCGVCAHMCPHGVREMVHDPRKVFCPPLKGDKVRIRDTYNNKI